MAEQEFTVIARARLGLVKAAPPATMFFVWEFSYADEDFLPIAAFSNQEEADALVTAKKAAEPKWAGAAVEQSFADVITAALRTKLGKMADALALAGVAPWPAEIWVVWDTANAGQLNGIYCDEKSARKALLAGNDEWRSSKVAFGESLDLTFRP